MRTGKLLLSFLLVAGSALSAAADPKSDVELANYLKSQLKCESGKRVNCSLRYQGLEMQFADMNDPAGGAMSVIDISPTQKYTNYGARCVMIEFTGKEFLTKAPQAKGMGIVFRSDGVIMPQSKSKEADALCY